MSKRPHAENRDPGHAGDPGGSRSAVVALVATAIVLHGTFVVALPALALVGYALAYWLWLTAFVALREEPDLRRTFGADYDAYCRQVPRWIPKFARRLNSDLPGE